MATPSFWTPAAVATLRRLREQGLTPKECAQRLGTTRNAIMGKLHRMKLSQGAELRPGGLLDLRPGQCRYPFGTRPYTFCPAAQAPGGPYCPEHMNLCYHTRPGHHLVR
jgi:hypothetical protein